LPLYLKRVHDANAWLESRAIDSHRANSRLLKKALQLKEKDDISTVLHVNGATITDTYWIKPLDSDLTTSKTGTRGNRWRAFLYTYYSKDASTTT